MPVDVPQGYAQVTIRYQAGSSLGSAPCVVLGFQTGVSTMQQVAEQVGDAWDDHLRAGIAQGVSLIDITAVNNTERGVDGRSHSGNAQYGQTLEPNCALLMRKITALRGRKFQGRTYWPYELSDAAVDQSGYIAAAALADKQTEHDAFFADLAGNDCDLVLLHATDNPTPVVSTPMQSVIATQRRRLRA